MSNKAKKKKDLSFYNLLAETRITIVELYEAERYNESWIILFCQSFFSPLSWEMCCCIRLYRQQVKIPKNNRIGMNISLVCCIRRKFVHTQTISNTNTLITGAKKKKANVDDDGDMDEGRENIKWYDGNIQHFQAFNEHCTPIIDI